jgi:ELWxxDGT repeat protein
MSIRLVKDINPAGASGIRHYPNFMTMGGTLFFLADDGANAYDLWKSDGTTSGTSMVKDLNISEWGGGGLMIVGSMLIINTGYPSYSLWRSDGSTAGTTAFASFPSICCCRMCTSGISQITAVGNTLFFVAEDIPFGLGLAQAGEIAFRHALWKSDGTAAGTTLVKEIAPDNLAAVGNTLFFRAYDNVHGAELWKSDGTEAGTTLVKDINPNMFGSYPDAFTAVGSTLFFVADDGVHGTELWKSDGTPAGTTLIKDINLTGETDLVDLTVVGSKLFFAANDGVHGNEPWTSDGTTGGTTLVQDLSPGTASAEPSQFTRVGKTLFFSAQTAATGYELWAMSLPYYEVYLPLTRP